jgi:hypothetical protein
VQGVVERRIRHAELLVLLVHAPTVFARSLNEAMVGHGRP